MYTKNMKIGKILSVHNAPENPFLFAFGGDFRKMNFKLFDIRENDIGGILKLFLHLFVSF